jgi:hypothetical protein
MNFEFVLSEQFRILWEPTDKEKNIIFRFLFWLHYLTIFCIILYNSKTDLGRMKLILV